MVRRTTTHVRTMRQDTDSFLIGTRRVGADAPVFVVAEAGVNHNGDLTFAKRLVDAAVDAAADAVKFQAFKAERLVSAAAPKAEYQRQTTDPHESQLDMLRRLELSPERHRTLQNYCRARGIIFMSTPFDPISTDMLEALDVPVFKIPSGEVTNWPFLEHVARKRKPIILSTGMSSLEEVAEAVNVLRKAGTRQFALLHCVSNYPADPAEANLRAIQTMAEAFHVPVGYSDHTLGIDVALTAVAAGACIIEKHLTLDQKLPGPDHRASLEPHVFLELVKGIRRVEAMLGHGRKEPTPTEYGTALVARKSLVAARDIPPGTRLTEEFIAIKRPGSGLPPAMQAEIVGRRAKRHIPADSLLTMDMLA